jgi:hypothetical protein
VPSPASMRRFTITQDHLDPTRSHACPGPREGLDQVSNVVPAPRRVVGASSVLTTSMPEASARRRSVLVAPDRWTCSSGDGAPDPCATGSWKSRRPLAAALGLFTDDLSINCDTLAAPATRAAYILILILARETPPTLRHVTDFQLTESRRMASSDADAATGRGYDATGHVYEAAAPAEHLMSQGGRSGARVREGPLHGITVAGKGLRT